VQSYRHTDPVQFCPSCISDVHHLTDKDYIPLLIVSPTQSHPLSPALVNGRFRCAPYAAVDVRTATELFRSLPLEFETVCHTTSRLHSRSLFSVVV